MTLIVMGDTQYKQTANGAVKMIRKKVKLDAAKGHWYWRKVANADAQGDTDKFVERKVPTAAGLEFLNRSLGISFVTPDKILSSEGVEVGNPCEKKNPNGTVDSIRIRLIGMGRGATGNLTVFDLTFIYNFTAYFASDIFNKWTYSTGYGNNRKQVVKPWGRLVNSELAEATDKKVLLPVSYGISLQIDLENLELFAIYQSHMEHQKYAMRRAITMARRNIIKTMAGITFLDDDSTIEITCWPEADRDLRSLLQSIADSKDGKVKIGDEEVQVVREEKQADEEDADPSIDDDSESEMDVPIVKDQPKQKEENKDFRALSREAITNLTKALGKERAETEVKDALLKCGHNSLKGIALNGSTADFKRLYEILSSI